MALITVAGGTLKILFHTLCGANCNVSPPTTVEWYLVFTCAAAVLAQLLPNLNSVAGVSLVGALTAVTYCTLVWVVPLRKGRPEGLSYGPVPVGSEAARVCTILNALGMIALAFRGHNLVLIIGLCLFPLAMGGHRAYGNLVSAQTSESFSSTHFLTSNLHPIKEPENSSDEVKKHEGKKTLSKKTKYIRNFGGSFTSISLQLYKLASFFLSANFGSIATDNYKRGDTKCLV